MGHPNLDEAAGGRVESRNEGMIGHSVPRVEDPALLTGEAEFADDAPLPPGAGHAHFVRSPHPHADVVSLDPGDALAMDGVYAVLTGADAARWSDPFLVVVRAPMEHRCLAADRVRYVGEPVAVVVARDRYLAEDAAERVRVEYAPRPAVVDPEEALGAAAPVLHDGAGAVSNLVHERAFRYGGPEAAFRTAPHRIGVEVRYPRNVCTPIEGVVVTAAWLRGDRVYEVHSNFQGPYSLHPVMARALRAPGSRLRLRAARHSGGSFGVKQSAFSDVVAVALAARAAGRPVRWTQDRMENLTAATAATNRVIRLDAAVEGDGRVRALRYDQIEDCGAYLRAPEPATLYRMHGLMTGAYDVEHLAIRNRVALTNKTPTGLNRGFGGPQVFFALESLMRRIAETLDLAPLDVIRRNLAPAIAGRNVRPGVRPASRLDRGAGSGSASGPSPDPGAAPDSGSAPGAGSAPYRAAAGARFDSGDFPGLVARTAAEGRLGELLARRRAARREGRFYGVGYAAVVETSISNMGYVTTLLSPEARERAGPKDGAVATATVSLDPGGAVTVTAASAPQGQGHRTVLAQVVGAALGLAPGEIVVNLEHDTQTQAWSIASGNYSSRFAGAVAGTAHRAALRIRARLAAVAARALNARPEGLVFAGGRIHPPGNPENAISLARAAGVFHWSPSALPEGMEPGLRVTEMWSPPTLAPPDPEDRINGAGAYAFVFDYCGVEVDAATARVRIDRYVTGHDSGVRLHPAMVDGQIRGAFAQGVGAALYEELRYGADGTFLAGTLADYPIPTACEVPAPVIVHHDTPSTVTPLGAKGVGEGVSMSAPVCLANAVADALGTGEVLRLPMLPARLAPHVARALRRREEEAGRARELFHPHGGPEDRT